ncbi:MAG TPA: hypothetical protein VFZ38_02150, partial [Vicinamibacterales bacterium]
MLTAAEIDLLVKGRHPDPFAVLGPHEVSDGLAIRVFRPRARTVELQVFNGATSLTPLRRIHLAGLYE